MTLWQIALKSLRFHRRVNWAIALGVAAATAVLTGALIVGDSMRGSLRDLTLERLGSIDSIVMGEGFFSEGLATALKASPEFNQSFSTATPIIFFQNGSAQCGSGPTLGQVNLLGIRDGFWALGDERVSDISSPAAGQVILNSVLANDIGITEVEVASGNVRVTIGVPKQQLLPSDSALGAKDNLVERLVDLKVVKIVPAESLGRFGLNPTQVPPRNAWVSMEELQSALNDDLLKYKSDLQQANVILVGSQASEPATAAETDRLRENLTPTLQDLGLSLKRVTQSFEGKPVFDYWSLSSDRLVLSDQISDSIRSAFPKNDELFVYLANEITPVASAGRGVPFSIIASVDFSDSFQIPSADGTAIKPLDDNEIAITRWVAEDQSLVIGDRVNVSYFEPETTHGDESSLNVEMTVAAIVEVTTPAQPFRVPRRGVITPATFERAPTTANDPDITPVVPGLTDAESIERWDLPFATADKIRSQDDAYWDFFRTTPKAYVSLATGRRLWGSRFGKTTSFRIEPNERTATDIEQRLLKQFRDDGHLAGLQVISVKRNGLAASSGSTPFDVLFLSLSMFVIAAALALVSILFRLALQRRSAELGVMLATGFKKEQISRIWLMEMLGVSLAGSLIGCMIGVGYAALMIFGLTTWWVGAITTPFLKLHINWWTLPAGLLCGVMICIATIYLSIRAARNHSVHQLLSGNIETGRGGGHSRIARLATPIMVVCFLAAIALTLLAATRLAGESQAGAFMSAGFLILAASLVWVWRYLKSSGAAIGNRTLGLARLATTGAARNPLRSALTIGLVAIASFLILAISAFRLSPTSAGTAGFNYVATTSQPVFADLNTAAGQKEILRGTDQLLQPTSRVLSLRFKPGQDASCNNLYQATQPQVLGVTPSMVQYFDNPDVEKFSFSMTSGENPWRLLDEVTDDGSIPVLIDKNTAWYSLKIYLPGTRFTIDYDSGESVKFQLVGLLSNTVLQGSLLVSEANFNRAFPDISGYRYFLMKLNRGDDIEPEIVRIASDLSDNGFEWHDANELLAGYLAVQNTYLSTFQSLGLLGLLLGTFGLAAVQLRSVFERRRELGLLRAVGFTRRQIAQMIVIENVWLLAMGLGIGIGAALVTVLPHYYFGSASVPWWELIGMFGFIGAVGLLTSLLASRSLFHAPLVESLRAA